MNPDKPNRHYYPALDGIRGLAILLVVIYHNFGFINYFFFGWLGVDLFFVLSGFLITDILLKTLGGKNYLKNFYIRRILRIFPLYYLSLIIFLLILPKLHLQLNLSYYTENQVWLWTYLQNWLYIFKDPNQTNTLNHLWSLAVEEQFYLIWPIIILLIRKPKLLLLFISLVLLAVLGFRLWIWTNHIADLAYFNLYTFSRIDGICIGCMVALLQRIKRNFLSQHTPWIVTFFAILNFIFFFINREFNFTFPYLALIGYTTFAMMFGLLVNDAASKTTPVINLLFNHRLLKFFGKISYGFYIFHWPIYLLIKPVFVPWIAEHSKGLSIEFIVSVSATLVAVGVSWLSYRYFESYFLKLKTRFD